MCVTTSRTQAHCSTQNTDAGIAFDEAANDSPGASNIVFDEKTSPDSHYALFQSQMMSPELSHKSGDIYPTTSSNFPPVHPSNSSTAPAPPTFDFTTPEVIQTKHDTFNPSPLSYYSVDAGKHGFFNRTKSTGSASDDNDSLVFKYLQGEETPPAEYALPASILGLYGERDDSSCDNDSVFYRLTPDSTDRVENKGNSHQLQLPPPLPSLSLDSPRILPYQERRRQESSSLLPSTYDGVISGQYEYKSMNQSNASSSYDYSRLDRTRISSAADDLYPIASCSNEDEDTSLIQLEKDEEHGTSITSMSSKKSRLLGQRHRNERLDMSFRVIVLISVASVFAGALAFVFVDFIRIVFA